MWPPTRANCQGAKPPSAIETRTDETASTKPNIPAPKVGMSDVAKDSLSVSARGGSKNLKKIENQRR
jgi:hypothetical protein